MRILAIFAVIFTRRWKWLTNIEVNDLTLYNQKDLNKLQICFMHMKEVYGNFRYLEVFDFQLAANKFTLQQEKYIKQMEELITSAVFKKNRIVIQCSQQSNKNSMLLAEKYLKLLVYNIQICEHLIYFTKKSIKYMVHKQMNFNDHLPDLNYTPLDFISLEVLPKE